MPICVLCIANIGINSYFWVYIGCTFSYFGLLFRLSVISTLKIPYIRIILILNKIPVLLS